MVSYTIYPGMVMFNYYIGSVAMHYWLTETSYAYIDPSTNITFNLPSAWLITHKENILVYLTVSLSTTVPTSTVLDLKSTDLTATSLLRSWT